MKRPGIVRKTPMRRGNTNLPRTSSSLTRSGPIKAKKRSPGDFVRIYHSRSRVQWVTRQSCVACGRGPCENAHTSSDDSGMGYKAGFAAIVPLCAGPTGCHAELHQHGEQTFEAKYGLDLEACAAATQYRWLAYAQQGAA